MSVNSAGIAGDQDSSEPFISANGRYVAFSSWASNLVPKTTNEYYEHHVFVRDLQEKKTTRVSVNSDGLPGDAFSVSSSPALSADGRFVAFASRATNLAPNDTNFKTDIFVHDQFRGSTKRISVDSSGNQGNDNSHFTELENPWINDPGMCFCVINGDPFAIGSGSPSITADGRFVAFDSYANNLITKDLNTNQDVFLHDRYTSTTRRVSVDSKGKEASYGSGFPSISADGRVVVFTSKANITNYTNPANPQGVFPIWLPTQENIYSKDLHVNSAKNTDIELTATNPPQLLANNIVESTFTVSNKGPENADGVTLTDVITGGSVISLIPSQGACSKAAISVCRFGSLATGEHAMLTIKIQINSNTLKQKLSVNANLVDSNPSNNSLTVVR